VAPRVSLPRAADYEGGLLDEHVERAVEMLRDDKRTQDAYGADREAIHTQLDPGET